MKKSTLIGLFAAGLMVAGCGAASYKNAPGAPSSYQGGYAESGNGAETKAAPMEPGAPSPAATSGAAGDAEGESVARSEERPGLGTEWGENRESHISTTTFFRENPDRPFDVVRMFYNDEGGVRAMARRAGISDFGDSSGRSARGALTVRLLDGSGNPLEGFSTAGNNYVVGQAGDRYIIEIRNNTGARFEAVATVDGLDVINGQTGSFANRGYIINPWSSVEIDGWRRSSDTVAAFRFGRVSNSYAAKTQGDRNVGVIGVAFFQERGATFPWTRSEVDRRHSADPFPAQFANPPPGGF